MQEENKVCASVWKNSRDTSVQLLSRVRLCDPMVCSTPGLPVHHCLLEFAQTHFHWIDDAIQPSNHLILCCPLLLLPSIFPSIRVFSNESAPCTRWPTYWSFSFSTNPSNEYECWFHLGWTGWISLQSKGLSKVFFNTTVQKHQFFGAQPSLWFNSHICTWPLEKPWLWLDGPLSAKWCLCFLLCCLGLSQLFFQGASVF